MNDTPMLFPIASSEFWKQIRTNIENVATPKLAQVNIAKNSSLLPEKALLKASDVCEIFHVSNPTLYEWLMQKKLKVFRLNPYDILIARK